MKGKRVTRNVWVIEYLVRDPEGYNSKVLDYIFFYKEDAYEEMIKLNQSRCGYYSYNYTCYRLKEREITFFE